MSKSLYRKAFPVFVVPALAFSAILAPAGLARAEDPDPKMVSFFLTRPTSTGTHCPAGWQDYEPLKGRFVFATTDPAGLRAADQAPMVVGDTPFNPKPKSLWHIHRTSEFLLTWNPSKQKLAWENWDTKLFSFGGEKSEKASARASMGGGWLKEPYEATAFHSGDGSARLAASWTYLNSDYSLPVYELKACVQDSATGLTEAMPLKSVAFFAGKSCPAGGEFDRWEPYEQASGYTMMALPDAMTWGTSVGKPQAVGYSGAHLHSGASWSVELGNRYVGDIYWAYAAWNTTKDLFPSSLDVEVKEILPDMTTAYQSSGFPTAPYDDVLVPNVHLLPCIKSQGKVSHKALLALSENYRDITTLRAAQHCDEYWETVEGSSGRLLLGLRDGAEPLHAWGDASTSDRPLNRHSHGLGMRYQGEVRKTANKDASSGTASAWLTGTGSGVTELNADSIPPHMMLRHCSLQRQPIPPEADDKS